MLRSLSMHNFVHFTQPQRMIFKPGVNFIIGPNSSGKTAIFEMIRRCMSNEINTTTSSIPDKTTIAYTICEFQFTPGETEFKSQHPIEGTILKSFPSAVVSCVFVEASEQSNYYKVFFARSDDMLEISILQFPNVSYDCYVNDLNNKNALVSQIKPVSIADFFNAIFTNESDIHDKIHRLFEQIKFSKFVPLQDISIINTFTWLTNTYVGLFPMRSLGPLQWTRSITRKSEEEKEKDYKEACKKAQILMTLLSDEKKDSIDWELENVFHKHLVSPYKFVKKKESIIVYNDEITEKRKTPLLKVPDGIVEAKQLSLLLSEKQTSTLTLEEPDRGMHPQMIKKNA